MPTPNARMTARQSLNDALGARAFADGVPRVLHRPLELHLQLVSGCNLDCYMCHEHLRPPEMRHGRHLRLLDPELFDRLARDVIPYTQRIELGVGGEPLLSPHFRTYLERCHGLNQSIHVTTNGTLLTTDTLAASLAEHSSRIEISIDGATAKTYERIRRGGRFAPLLRNLENLQRHRAGVGPSDRPSLTLCMVLMRSNLAELPDLVRLAASLGADGVAAWPVIPVTEEGRSDGLEGDRERLHEVVEEARSIARSRGIDFDAPVRPSADSEPRTDEPEEGRRGSEPTRPTDASHREAAAARLVSVGRGTESISTPRCHMPFQALYVLWNGDVFPCGNPLAHEHAPLGNLASQSFEEIWNGRALRNLRVGLGGGDVPSICERCPVVRRDAHGSTGTDSPVGLVEHFEGLDLAPDPLQPADLLEHGHRSGLGEGLVRSRELAMEVERLRRRVADLEVDLEGHRAHRANLEGELLEARRHGENLGASLEAHLRRDAQRFSAKWLRPIARGANRALGRTRDLGT